MLTLNCAGVGFRCRMRLEKMNLDLSRETGSTLIAQLPYMAKWAAGEPDDLQGLGGRAMLREHVKAGRSVRRARVVSEPLSDDQRWS